MGFSERKIIGEICKSIRRHPSVTLPAGHDDAAVVSFGPKRFVLTSDIMFRSSHFPKGMKPEEMGRKAVIANLSDLASMGVKPTYVMLSLGIPKKYGGISGLIKGITSTCSEYNVIIVGGDTKSSKELTLSICAIGETKGRILARKNARPGDVVAVTGEIGSAFCGLHSLLHGQISPLTRSFTHPRARIREGLVLSSSCSRAAGMDITDGLLYTASEIARASKVGMEIESKSIPISKQARSYSVSNRIPFIKLINTGEDYELLLCLSKKDFERVNGKANLKKIGEVIKGKGIYLDGKKNDAVGYDAFFSKL